MNKNKFAKLTSILFAASSLLLGSCYFFGGNINQAAKKDSNFVTYKKGTTDKSYSSANLKRELISYSSMLWHPFPSSGSPKLLVVPVQTSNDKFNQSELDMIEKGFFGQSSDTGWESVSSYYEKSSYSKLKIKGSVTAPVTCNFSSSYMELENKNDEYFLPNLLVDILEKIDSSIDFNDYDYDNDGYIDAVWFVYSPKFVKSNETLFWAFTSGLSFDSNTINNIKNQNIFEGKIPSAFSWASVDFFKESGYIKGGKLLADSHTFIHETGHLLGQEDFYNYDYSINEKPIDYDTPMGGVDMMDFNIGDHCAFTKYLMEWEKPIIINQSYLNNNSNKITLKSHTETGNSLLLPTNDYNNTPYDEYLLLEYYTPTNLNSKDTIGYTNNLGTYSSKGLLVTHIDARVGKFLPDMNGNPYWDGCVYDSVPSMSSDWNKKFMFAPIYSNTKSDCVEKSLQDSFAPFYRGTYISLLPATGNKIQGDKTGYASNSSLFKKGNSFSKSYPTFTFDNGDSLPFDFEITSISSDECEIEFK